MRPDIWLFGVVGMLWIGLGIPLVRGKVRPNPWYGVRVRATLEDERLWYPVNRLCGFGMAIVGLLMVVTSVFLAAFPVRQDISVVIQLSIMVVGSTWVLIQTFAFLKKLQRNRPK